MTILITACVVPTAVPTPAGTITPATDATASPVAGTESPTPTDIPPTPVPNLGEVGNPILLSLPPAQILDAQVIASGEELAAKLQELTGLRVRAVAPSSYTELIDALKVGNAHIASLSPYPIVKAYQEGAIRAAYASTQDEKASYGAQIVARSDQFESFFDPNAGRNIKDPPDILQQFSGKKPCWTDNESFSGYRVAAGMFGWYQIPLQEGAFLNSHYSVVRAIEIGGVCDFGSTYIDARNYPALKDQFPNLMDEIVVVWQIPAIIPYNGLFYSTTLPEGIAAQLTAAFQQVALDAQGKILLKSLYDMDAILPVQDVFYTEFVRYITASDADWEDLVH